jgi:hypothetical protein
MCNRATNGQQNLIASFKSVGDGQVNSVRELLAFVLDLQLPPVSLIAPRYVFISAGVVPVLPGSFSTQV